MNAKQIHEDRGQRTFALVFDAGDEVVSGLTDFAAENGLDAASFTAIGAFGTATLGYFDLEEKEYERIPVHEQVEVLSLLGNVATKEDGQPLVHAHAVLGASDGSTRGGHLLEARVRPTLEVVLVESPEHLRRREDRETGLPLVSV
ncbi:MAG: DNA-binding protein [Actinomycetota bacterium]|nr:DNA-binding protein [Actinomycetota bacterium]MDP9474105.1 DNA-binding protein [Actinomycetota bacterium]